MNNVILGQYLHQIINGWQDRAVQEIGVVAVVILLLVHGLVLGGELFRNHILKRPYATEPPLRKRLIEHPHEVKTDRQKSKGEFQS